MSFWNSETQWVIFKAKELKDDPEFLLKKLYEKKFNQIIDNLNQEITMEIVKRKEDDEKI